MAGTTTGEPVIFNPFEPGFFDDPYRQYQALREHDPVHRSPLEVWVLFRYDDIVGILRDSSLSVQVDNAVPTARWLGVRAPSAKPVLVRSSSRETSLAP